MKTHLKLVACWLAVGVAFLMDGVLVWLLHLRTNSGADHTAPMIGLVAFAAGAGFLVLGMWPMARGLVGSMRVRAVLLALFLFLALGVNTIFDGAIYTSAFDGAIASSLLTYVLLSTFLGIALGAGFGEEGSTPGFMQRRGMVWAVRGVTAWLAWPVIYFIFGACIAPIVLPIYQSGVLPGIHIPPFGEIVGVQLVRSALFLVASLPLIALWKGSRQGLWLALGLAHTVAVGVFGLMAATFMPAVLRITHGVEITCDSFAYAGLLVLLFSTPAASKAKSAATRHDAPLHAL